jgi:hypothetical protein
MGTFDRAVRAFVVAPVAIDIAFAVGPMSIGGFVLLAVASIALATGATGVCPAYIPFGIDTRGRTPLHHRKRRDEGGREGDDPSNPRLTTTAAVPHPSMLRLSRGNRRLYVSNSLLRASSWSRESTERPSADAPAAARDGRGGRAVASPRRAGR